ncbi:MAG: ABC transporter permease [Cyclobacteriaceae bacterium]
MKELDRISHFVINLLERVLIPSIRNEVVGDLIERYYQNLNQKGIRMARRDIVFGALKYLRYIRFIQLSNTQNSTSMGIWRNYFLASMRNLMRHKRYSAISLLGLVVGFATTLAIIQYVSFESNYDTFYPNKEIYRLTHTFTNNSGSSASASSFMALRDVIHESVPEARHVTHFIGTGGLVKVGESVFDENRIVAANSDFFDVFGIELLEGNIDDLNNPDVVFLSESNAKRYFGSEGVLGQTIELQGVFGETWNATVGGVFQEIPTNSHLRVETIFSGTKFHAFIREEGRFGAISPEEIPWRFLGFHTYVIPEPNADKSEIVKKSNALIAKHREKINQELEQKHEVWLQHVSDIHTTANIVREITPTNDKSTIRLFAVLAMLVLFIAWINYINLSTAKAVTRGKEVGVRKVLGSNNAQLRNQFLLEALLLNLISFVMALGLLIPVAPYLDDIVGVEFMGNLFVNGKVLLFGLGVLVFGSLLSGLYPALVLANYDCLKVLKGKIQYSSSGVMLRRSLVVVQFVFSIFLISALFIVQSQMKYMLNSNLGVNIDQTYLINAPINLASEENYTSRVATLRNHLNGLSGVKNVSLSSIVPGVANGWRASIERRTEGAGLFIHRSLIDESYMSLYDLQLVAGTDLEHSGVSDEEAILVNETTKRQLGYERTEDIIHERLYFAGEEYVVVGVVADFYQQGIHSGYEPMSFSMDTALRGNFISVKLNTQNIESTKSIEELYRSAFPDAPYNARFLDDVFQDQYAAEFRFRDLITLFTGITLVIACLGLIGLSSYMISQKMNEISIRKVLGASGSGLFMLLNKEYIAMSLLAFVIASPAIYFLSPLWLNDFENRIAVHPGYYIISLLFIFTVVILTTLSHTLRAIHVNPSKMLKEE